MISDEPAPLAVEWLRSKRMEFPAESNSGKTFFPAGHRFDRAVPFGPDGRVAEDRGGCVRTATVATMGSGRIVGDYRNSGSSGGFFGDAMRNPESDPLPDIFKRANVLFLLLRFDQSDLPVMKPLSIVVADDVDGIRHLMEHGLTDLGHQVFACATGNEVVKLLSLRPVDLVITDVLMPDGDGLEVIAALRKKQLAVRVLAISGGGQYLAASDCLKVARGLGAHAVLLKPFDRQKFLDAIAQVLPDDNRATA